jgi:hypothetical protein
MGQEVEDKMAAGFEAGEHPRKDALEIALGENMIQRVEVRCGELNSAGKPEVPYILQKEANTAIATIGNRRLQHCRRAVHADHRDAVAAGKPAGKQTRAAPQVHRRAKAQPVAAHELFEGRPQTAEKTTPD